MRYLDGEGIPERYLNRLVEGQPIPPDVRAEMERSASDPWNVRDRMLAQILLKSGGSF